MSRVVYDAQVIQEHAENLYRQARSLISLYAFAGLIIGAAVGYFAGRFLLADPFLRGSPEAAVVGALAFGVLGALVGRARGFTLRLQAQTALCYRQIEENTRPR